LGKQYSISIILKIYALEKMGRRCFLKMRPKCSQFQDNDAAMTCAAVPRADIRNLDMLYIVFDGEVHQITLDCSFD
jgi:hypothetical protein